LFFSARSFYVKAGISGGFGERWIFSPAAGRGVLATEISATKSKG
jgi:hypothetical protein